MRRTACLFVLALLLGCSGAAPTPTPVTTAETLYGQAQATAKTRDFEEATKFLERLRDEFPFSRFAVEGELLLADIAFDQEKFPEATVAYRSFEDTHPTHPRASHAVYRRGLAQMELSQPEDRDQSATRAALEAFQKLIHAYPGSEREADARKRIAEARNRLGAHEVYVAQYYLRRSKFEAAAARLEGAVRDFPDTPSKNQALQLLEELKGKREGKK